MAQYQQMTQGSLAGVRGALTSFDTFKGPALGARMIKPFADTMTNQVASSFLSALTGPDGLFGKQLAKLFNSQIFLEGDMIRNAHIEGITAGFASVGMYGPGALSANGGIADAGTGSLSVGAISRTEKLKQLAVTGGTMAGNLLGGQLGTKHGVNNGSNYGSEGAQLGATLGAVAGSFIPIPGLGTWAGAALGGAAGGLLGGFFGGRVGKQTPPPAFAALDRIDRNTRETVSAIEAQTHGLLNLENRLLNVPANFRIPGYAVAGAGGFGGDGGAGGWNVTVNVTEAQNAQNTSQRVVDALRAELRGAGSYVSPRGTRN
jgi:hypothetical protein